MALESATHINQLQPLNPDGTDNINLGDDHIRMIKSVLTTDLANIGGAVTASHTELNYVTGVTSSIQTQLNSLNTLKAPLASPALTGTPTAPTPANGDTSTNIATTAFVASTFASSATIYDLVDVTVSTSNSAGAPSTIRTREHVDTTSGAISRYLPTGTLWQVIQFVDAKRTWATNNLTIFPQAGQAIENGANGEGMLCTNFTDQPLLQWDGSVWRLIG